MRLQFNSSAHGQGTSPPICILACIIAGYGWGKVSAQLNIFVSGHATSPLPLMPILPSGRILSSGRWTTVRVFGDVVGNRGGSATIHNLEPHVRT